MRDERYESHKSPASANTPNGQGASKDAAAGGFTAVNGEESRAGSFRPDKTYRYSSTPRLPEPAPAAWTPYGNDRTQLDDYSAFRVGRERDRSEESNKRKRIDGDGTVVGGSSYAGFAHDDDRPIKQRRTHPVDSAVEQYSNERALSDAQRASTAVPLTAGGQSRELTPTRRADASLPPPRPNPETEARLAESLQRELGTAGSPQIVEQSSPPDQGLPYNDQQPQQYSPEQGHANDSSEGRKGKRNYRPRTKTGCHTCRERKKKCDEGKPSCLNCVKGNFYCKGYGPKPATGIKSNANRNNVPLQAKHPYEPSHGPAGHYPMPEGPPPPPHQQPPPPQGTSYSHWGRVQQEPPQHRYSELPDDVHRPSHRESYPPARPSWPIPPHELPPTYPPDHYITPDYPSIPPLQALVRDAAPDTWSHPSAAAAAAAGPYRPGPLGPERILSSHGSVSSERTSHHHPPQRAAQLALSFPSGGQMTEKDKMLLGKPYLHYLDTVLCSDREACKSALERYNDAARPSSGVSTEERARLFRAIVDPSTRAGGAYRASSASGRHLITPDPVGRIGHRTLVETPFNCDYGYNIQLGDDSVIGANCYMMDPCEIVVGNRVIVGPNVKFYGMTAAVDSRNRKGSQGTVTGGAIVIEDDVVIGGDAIIMPYRTIGKGAYVGAGCVVTKDVKPNTVVVGNPMKLVRGIGGADIERHKEPIQRENDEMLHHMQARRGYREN